MRKLTQYLAEDSRFASRNSARVLKFDMTASGNIGCGLPTLSDFFQAGRTGTTSARMAQAAESTTAVGSLA